MVRMWVDRSTFRPYPADVRRLLPVEIGDLNRLYQLGFASWLPSSAISDGVYYGLRVGGRLVAAAGTHVISPDARLAVVGNVLTHNDYRGRGFATATTGAVTADLLRTCDQIVLNVRADNPPALQAYRRLGYAEHVRFEERLVHRLGSPWPGLPGPLRRFLISPKENDRPMTATTNLPAHDVTDLGLADEGVRRIEWAEREMPVLRLIRERFERERPLDGLRIGACLHVTTETANLMRTLKAGGAEVVLAASNPLSTKDDVAAALVAAYGIACFARRGEDRDTYYAHLNAVADTHPQLTMDDGCDLVSLLHSERPAQVEEILAGTEETTTGVIRLKAMAADGALGSRSWRSTRPRPSTSSTTVTGPASRPSTGSCARRTS